MLSAILRSSFIRCYSVRPIVSKFRAFQPRSLPNSNFYRFLSNSSSTKHEFRAETQKLLDIVAKSLYSEKEVFLRELISNASDALEKRRLSELKTNQICLSDGLSIKIEANSLDRTLSLVDNGTGMTREELEANLGVIAKSGTKDFVDSDDRTTTQNLIGQFGVGFYSAFMVASKVEVFTRTASSDQGFVWSSEGHSGYEIEKSPEDLPIGTRVVLHLRGDCTNFAKKDVLKSIVRKYSNFISFPILLENEQINSTKALWLRDPKDVPNQEYLEFFKYIETDHSPDSSTPHFTIHFRSESPMSVHAILFIPHYSRRSSFDSPSASDRNLSLYNRNVLITNNAQSALLPNWLRFVRGVVESEDIPLNLSREMLQDSIIISRLKTILVQKVIRYLVDQSERDPEKYNEFYRDFGLFFKDGIARSQSPNEREEIARLLRFESSELEAGTLTNLDQYVKRMKPNQRFIYYLGSVNRNLAISSPYYETFKKIRPAEECLLLIEPHDEAVILHLAEFNGKRLQSIEQEIDNQRSQDDSVLIGTKGALTNEEAQDLKKWMVKTFSDKIKNVKINTKLAPRHPLAVTTPEMGAVRNFLNSPMSRQASFDIANLCKIININADINPSNPVILALSKLRKEQPKLAEQLGNQLIQNAMVSAGLIADPRIAMEGVNELIANLLNRKI